MVRDRIPGRGFGDDWLPDGPDARPVSLIASSYSVGNDFFELYAARVDPVTLLRED